MSIDEYEWKRIEEKANLSALRCIKDAQALERDLVNKHLKKVRRVEITIEAFKEHMQMCSKLKRSQQKDLFISIKELLRIVLVS
jgi:hypothetical protein